MSAYTNKRAIGNVAQSQADSVLVIAVADRRIRVCALAVVEGATATGVTFNTKGAGAGAAISPLLANGANGGEILPYMEEGWFETSVGEALSVTTGAGSASGILVIYHEV